MNNQPNYARIFLLIALIMLILGLIFGVLSAQVYLIPDFLKKSIGFQALRPIHVSSVMFWIIIGASGCVFGALQIINHQAISKRLVSFQLLLWLVAIVGIFSGYSKGEFGGREYWEFNPIWALPIALAWILFLINFFKVAFTINKWPVYMWMWMTGVIFFLFTFIENYLWVFPYFRSHFITDMTIQWKVNGSLVGSWNQLIYGTAFFLMDRISKDTKVGFSKLAFAMFFLGLTNLMFNWGHHIYTLPTEPYIRHLGYVVSMTEWVFFIRIIYTWKQSVSQIQKHFHYFPYRFIIAADIWVFINMGQAILMSIPALNIFTHGTHVTVAHAMGTTIGINTMILLAACFEFFGGTCNNYSKSNKMLNISFWGAQFSLLIFWISLNIAGLKKGLWQLSEVQIPFSKMMGTLKPWFYVFAYSGVLLMAFLTVLSAILIADYLKCISKNKEFSHDKYLKSEIKIKNV